jgi:hypothetical protein
MLKLIIFSLLGKKIVSTRVLFNSIKSYLIVYMLILPAFLHAMGSAKITTETGPVSGKVVSFEVRNYIDIPGESMTDTTLPESRSIMLRDRSKAVSPWY